MKVKTLKIPSSQTLTKEIKEELNKRKPFDKEILEEKKEDDEVSKKSNTKFYIGLLLVALPFAAFVWKYLFFNSTKSSGTDSQFGNKHENTGFRL